MISNMTARLAFRLTLNHILYITFLRELWHYLYRKISNKEENNIFDCKKYISSWFHKQPQTVQENSI